MRKILGAISLGLGLFSLQVSAADLGQWVGRYSVLSINGDDSDTRTLEVVSDSRGVGFVVGASKYVTHPKSEIRALTPSAQTALEMNGDVLSQKFTDGNSNILIDYKDVNGILEIHSTKGVGSTASVDLIRATKNFKPENEISVDEFFAQTAPQYEVLFSGGKTPKPTANEAFIFPELDKGVAFFAIAFCPDEFTCDQGLEVIYEETRVFKRSLGEGVTVFDLVVNHKGQINYLRWVDASDRVTFTNTGFNSGSAQNQSLEYVLRKL